MLGYQKGNLYRQTAAIIWGISWNFVQSLGIKLIKLKNCVKCDINESKKFKQSCKIIKQILPLGKMWNEFLHSLMQDHSNK